MYEVPERIRAKLKDVTDEPGCYMMRDLAGRIIYVGKALSLRKRVRSYFRPSTFRKADPKLRSLLKSAADIEFMVLRNEAEALLTESRLIKEYKPRYNALLKDDKRFLLIRAEMSTPFPSFGFCRIKREDGALYFGPFTSSVAVRSAIEFVEKKFGLRKCKPRVPDEDTYKHCLDDILRYCSAPCVKKVSEEEYRERFDEACEFLRGKRPEYLHEISDQMREASSRRNYERAARLRDLFANLRDTTERQARMLPTPEMKREEALQGVRELKEVLKLHRLPRVIEAFDISNISGTMSVASMVCAVDGMPKKNRYRRYRIKGVQGIDDQAMIQEVVGRRAARISQEGGKMPDLILVDGGVTQLKAGLRALADSGRDDCDILGLAKKYEELYVPASSEPVRLGRSSLGLKVLRRLRDEAHRFALEYHRSLRNKRIRESRLDDIQGVGPSKKKLLLAQFGSVRRLASASEDKIASVSGIGYKLAKEIKEALASGAPSQEND